MLSNKAFNLHEKADYKEPIYFNTRASLYAPTAKLDTIVLDAMGPAAEAFLARKMYAIARQAKTKARKAAPKRTGALRAGIYVTAPASQADMQAIFSGKGNPLRKMAQTTSGYYRAVNAAAKRMGGIELPGSAENKSEFVFHRTQGLKSRVGPVDIAESVNPDYTQEDDVEDLEPFYQETNKLLPFNPTGNAGRGSFFVGLGSAVYYSAWVEYGNSKFKGQAFFTPAAQWMAAQVPKAINDAMGEFEQFINRQPKSSKVYK